uniref:TrkH family potassium uptake protein n=1 Tax=Rodentolepis nana TaxID=102285 RepID=A0A0R3TGY0_RODNA
LVFTIITSFGVISTMKFPLGSGIGFPSFTTSILSGGVPEYGICILKGLSTTAFILLMIFLLILGAAVICEKK